MGDNVQANIGANGQPIIEENDQTNMGANVMLHDNNQ
jgi:hypothetical protein